MSVFLSSVEGNSQWLDGGSMFGNIPRAVWKSWAQVDDESRIRLNCRAMLIECNGQRILCETGIGAFFEPKLAQRFGVAESEHVLLASLAKLGVTEEQIDFVILSHLHFDHAGGLLPKFGADLESQGGLHFPKAKYLVGRSAFERAVKPHARDRASFVADLPALLEKSGRLVLIDGEKAPGIFEDRLRFLYTDGHTPGHMHVLFKGEEQSVFFAGDLVPGVAWVHSVVTMGYDRFPEKVIDEKLKVYDRAVREGWLFFYTHDTKTAASQIVKSSSGKFEASALESSLVRRAL